MKRNISTAPGGPHADRGQPTDYQASRGSWRQSEDRPTPGEHGRHDGRLRKDDPRVNS